jgi:hypothetical protein
MVIEEENVKTSPLQISFLNQALLLALLVPNLILIVFWNPIDRWTTTSVKLFSGL